MGDLYSMLSCYDKSVHPVKHTSWKMQANPSWFLQTKRNNVFEFIISSSPVHTEQHNCISGEAIPDSDHFVNFASGHFFLTFCKHLKNSTIT